MIHPGPPPTAHQKLQTAAPSHEPSSFPATEQCRLPAPTSEPTTTSTASCAHQEAARSSVNAIVNAAASNAALQEERARVQGLISNLVSRVANGNEDDEEPAQRRSVSQRKRDSADKATPSYADGVVLNDHRTFVVRGGPLSWSQNADSVSVMISVPAWVRKEHVVVRFLPGALAVRVGFVATGEPHFAVTQPLFGSIDVDGSLWMLEGAGKMRKLTLELEKGRMRWWPRLFMADDPADYVHVAENSLGSPVSAESDVPPPPPCEISYVAETDADSIPPPPDVPPPPVEEDEEVVAGMSGNLEDSVREVVDDIVDAVAGSSKTSLSRARMFSSPEGVQRPVQPKVLTAADIARMAEQYKGVVETGGPGAAPAALQLGMFHHHGIGSLPQSDALAAKYYRFALENGAVDADAAFRLGLIYNQGADGVEPDPVQAVRWWRVAAALCNPVAMFNLGVMAMNGNGCDMDPMEAMVWFRRAQALNPQLQPPAISKAHLAERMKVAERVRKERAKANMSPEEKLRRRDAAMADLRAVGYATAGIAGITVLTFALRHWWQNRL